MTARSIECGIIYVFLICVLITGSALAETDDPWAYSEKIVVTENAGKDLTGYQVPIILDSSNFNFSKAKADGSDLRFFVGEKELDYWVETWDPKSGEATVWVRVSFLPANGQRTVLMKYGNPAAKSVSSGKDTFEFFDDFTGSSLQSLFWNAKYDGEGFVEVRNGICKLVVPRVHPNDFSLIYTRDSFEINSMFVARRMKVTTGEDERGPLLRQGLIDQIDTTKNEIKHETELANETRVRWELTSRKENFRTFDLTNVRVPEGEWYTSGIAWYGDDDNRSVAWFKNGVRDSRMDYTSTAYVTNLPMHLYLYAASYSDASDNTGYMAVDYVLVRKFVGVEPTIRFVSAPAGTEPAAEETEPAAEEVTEPKVGEVSTPEVPVPEEPEQAPENLTEEEETVPEVVFPEYSVDVSGIRLSSPYQFNFPSLVKGLEASGIDTIFLSVDTTDVWQYERFVKSAHEEGLEVYAVLLEDPDCTGAWDLNTSLDAVDAVLDYNKKSLGAFDGITIYMESSADPASKDGCMDYVSLFEAASEKAGGNVSFSANLPPRYAASNIEEIAPFVDFFVVRAYDRGTTNLNSSSLIVDAVVPQMGEIRGAGSKGLIEVSVGEGFEDKMAIQKCFASLVKYYSGDSTFLGVSVSDYKAYAGLPMKAEKAEEEPEKPAIPGFKLLSVLLAGLGAFALLRKGNK
ncbi:DUF2341 domain-containing protein [Methanosarcina sp. KYL-1]|uniref:DUF2341 domain-containing protein n=1 Tax=Methanosarcina sp. KYL-1 TaxID=2602068 RepID=UPI00210114B7|nr:DUF2341 domain-containing protein [Methanosarcina sp. KYL-1]MCQ1534482.1 DUF2341 domain-containing protein [Methanosarcina sp. KYL-1]